MALYSFSLWRNLHSNKTWIPRVFNPSLPAQWIWQERFLLTKGTKQLRIARKSDRPHVCFLEPGTDNQETSSRFSTKVATFRLLMVQQQTRWSRCSERPAHCSRYLHVWPCAGFCILVGHYNICMKCLNWDELSVVIYRWPVWGV